MNARFWVWHNGGWVRITVRPGFPVYLSEGGATQEGYSYTHTVYEHRGDYISQEWNTTSRDCDGRLDSAGVVHAWLRDLAVVENQQGDLVPLWESVESYQRDHSAEAMGY